MFISHIFNPLPRIDLMDSNIRNIKKHKKGGDGLNNSFLVISLPEKLAHRLLLNI